MRKKLLISLFLTCILALSLLAFNVRQVWAWDWEWIRPAETGSPGTIYIDEHIHGAETDGKASIGLGLHIGKYFDNDPLELENDGLVLKMVATGNTRKIINYALCVNQDYHWHDNLLNQLYLWDDSCDLIDTFKIRFYGGIGDGEYYSLWVSSNGALFFDDPCTDPNYSPGSIPNTDGPNGFIAPFWRDLKIDQGGSITWGYVTHPGVSSQCLVISWNNIPDVNGDEQTFQVVIERGPTYAVPSDPSNYWQSRIWFQYKSITLGVPTTVGIEDQLGEKGNSHPTGAGDIPNLSAMLLTQQGNYAVITSLTMEMVESDSSAYIDINEDNDYYKGNNVYLQDPPQSANPELQYGLALAGGATLLIGLVSDPPIWLALSGFVLGSMLFGVDMVDALEAMAQLPSVETLDQTPNGVTNYARVFARQQDLLLDAFPVDAWFGIQFKWLFTDNNTDDHALTVRTKLTYEEYTYYGTSIGSGNVITSQTLRVRANTQPTASNLQISPSNPTTTDDLTASYYYYDADSDPEQGSEIRWYKNGVLQPILNDVLTVGSGLTSKAEEWYFTVKPNDGTDFGELQTLQVVTVFNTPPEASNPAITPSSPLTIDDLVASYDYDDADNDEELGSEIRWYKNGVLQSSFNDCDTVVSSATAAGEDWYFTVKPKDGENFGDIATSPTCTIENTAPVVSNLQIDPSSPLTLDDLVANYDYYDVDSDPESGSQIRWYKNGILQSDYNDNLIVLSSATASGETWYYTVRPKDGTEFGVLKTSTSVVIQNTPPVASNPQISPSAPTSADDLVASYDYDDADNDLELGSQIRWYRNGVLQSDFNDLKTVPSSATASGEAWYYTVRPKDGTEFGVLKTSTSVTITPTHDVAVTNITLSKTIVGQGYSMQINATVANEGDFTETFDVLIYLHIWPMYMGQVTLAPEETQILTYVWDTSSYSYGDYPIHVYTQTVPGETNTDNNFLNGGTVLVTIPGDVDGDHDVDIFDITLMANAYNSVIGAPNYDPNCDIDGDGDVDIFDIVIAAGNYGQSW